MRQQFPAFENVTGPIPEYVVNNNLNGILNSEIKTGLALTFLSDYDEAHPTLDVTHAFTDTQGDPPAWHATNAQIVQFCELSLEPVAQFLDGSKAQGWRVRPEHAAGILALAGFVSDWSLRNADVSVQQVYGKTCSRSSGRSPEFRHSLFKVMLAAKEDDMSIYTIAQKFPVEARPRVERTIKQLVENGILNKDTVAGSNPDVRITRTEVPPPAMRKDLAHETDVLYRALGRMQIGDIISVHALIDAALHEDDSIDPTVLLSKIRGGIFADGYAGLQWVQERTPRRDHRTAITFDETVLEPIQALTEGVSAVQSGGSIPQYARRAVEIFRSPADFHVLIAKGRAFSSSVQSQEGRETTRQILDILQPGKHLTLAQIRAALPRTLTTASLRSLIQPLVKRGTVTREAIARARHGKTSLNAYYIEK